jgi:hypothetical protein
MEGGIDQPLKIFRSSAHMRLAQPVQGQPCTNSAPEFQILDLNSFKEELQRRCVKNRRDSCRTRESAWWGSRSDPNSVKEAIDSSSLPWIQEIFNKFDSITDGTYLAITCRFEPSADCPPRNARALGADDSAPPLKYCAR